jgi:hypothetical protein
VRGGRGPHTIASGIPAGKPPRRRAIIQRVCDVVPDAGKIDRAPPAFSRTKKLPPSGPVNEAPWPLPLSNSGAAFQP